MTYWLQPWFILGHPSLPSFVVGDVGKDIESVDSVTSKTKQNFVLGMNVRSGIY